MSGHDARSTRTRAFEAVADTLREEILKGEISIGDRLVSEAELGQRFEVGRSTVREALRILAAEGLVLTARGPTGGTFVASPDPLLVTSQFTDQISLLSGSAAVTTNDLLETRAIIETEAARLAALRCTDEDVKELRSLTNTTSDPNELRSFARNRGFHEVVFACTHNTLLEVVGVPIFSTLQNRFRIREAPPKFWRQVDKDHRSISQAIEARDADSAFELMSNHLETIRPTYERLDPTVRDDSPARTGR